MDCTKVRGHLQAHLDQLLAPEESATVQEHLYGCEGCWQEMMMLTSLPVDLKDPELQWVVRHEPSSLPADFTEQVMAQIEAERPTGLNLVWPWLQRRWSRRQYASVAYAMSATMVVVSAGNLLFLWNETTNRFGLWAAQGQAYWEALHAYLGGAGVYLGFLWQGLAEFMRLG